MIRRHSYLSLCLISALFFSPSCTSPAANVESTFPEAIAITSIYFSDGDSGRINGTLKFRLNDIDAPETGGLGAAIGAAKCELERERGFEAKEWAANFTRGGVLEITESYDTDRYERLVIDLSVNGQDVGLAGLALGHYQPWPHDGAKALKKRPRWCHSKIPTP